MATYVIGDIQGCYRPLRALLQSVDFKPQLDHLWLAGDLVNRGPDNLSVLRFCADLGDRVKVVLGNHDLHLLATAYGARPVGRKDTMADILEATDRDDLLCWLRHQNMMFEEGDYCISHAGIPHIWHHQQALCYAAEVEAALQGPQHIEFFHNMYGDKPNLWQETLTGWQRLRVITNYFTRMRFVDPVGTLDFNAKEGPENPPLGMRPWFAYPRQRQDDRMRFLFGHWAALEGHTGRDRYHALDTGCVWGGHLTALRLEDQRRFRVSHKAKAKLATS